MDPNEKARFDDLHGKLTATLPHCLKTRKNARTPDRIRVKPECHRKNPDSDPFPRRSSLRATVRTVKTAFTVDRPPNSVRNQLSVSCADSLRPVTRLLCHGLVQLHDRSRRCVIYLYSLRSP